MSSPALLSGRARPVPADPELRERDERLESLKAVVGKLAHDFNNFMVPQLGYVTLIKEDLPADSTNAQYVGMLEDSARKTEAALESILLGMRPHRRFNPVSFNISELLAECAAKWHADLPETAQITMHLQITSNCYLNGDADQWENVFKQILSNARYALATGGTLQIVLRPQSLLPAKMEELGIIEPNGLFISFKDDGFGMSSAILRRAFEPFFTTRTQTKVQGIGLTIVHSVVQLHGGQVQIMSEEDAGTTLVIHAPLVPLPSLKTTLRTSGGKAFAGRVLLVDDDPLVREVLRTALLRLDIDVVLANNGAEGLHAFKKYAGQWDLIISDVAMPNMSGIEFINAARAVDKDVPAVLISGDPSATDSVMRAFSEPRPLLVKKPFTLRAFNDVVRNYVRPAQQDPKVG